MSSIQYIDLRANQLSTLPESMINLTQLTKLDLRWNNFTTKPSIINKLRDNGCIVFI